MTFMRDRMKLLDLFCGAGGASMGYHRAGFDVVGVDLRRERSYPFGFTRSDAMDFPLDGYDLIHASPPCQIFSKAQRLMEKDHIDFVAGIRQRLVDSGIPYVIENVVGAPLVDPILLCGSMFDLLTYRHRLFETSFKIAAPAHPKHTRRQTKMGRAPIEGEAIHVVGNFIGVEYAKKAMDIDWMSRRQIAQAIPPAYSEYIGREFLKI